LRLAGSRQYTDPAGRLQYVTLPNGLVVTYAYDRDSHVTSLSYGSLGSLTYGYDADGHRTSVGGGFAYTNIPAAISSISYNADNSPALINGSAGVGNDNDGYITCIGGNTCPEFSYDSRGHLQQWAANPYTIDYSYDAFGRRTQRNDGGILINYYQYDGLTPVAITNLAGVIDLLEGMGLDDLYFWSNNEGTPASFLRDPMDSTIGLVNSSGTIIDQTRYDPYGNTTDTSSTQLSPFEFTGRENEGGGYAYTNLYYMRGRYYNPAIGRFISRDPAGLSGGTNLYAYAGDDPVDLNDPTGMWEVGPECGDCPKFTGATVGPGVYSPQSSVLPNYDGIDHSVIEFYDGSQNGGGLRLTGDEEKPGGPMMFEMPGSAGAGAPDWVGPPQPDQPALPSDLDATLQRIARGERFPHVRDGTIFKNREGRLPPQPPGYYKEYVVPTPGVSGPGKRRVVMGAGGEVYYSPNHYDSFIQVK
jgi:RHS repeat-associated protein